MPQGRPKVVSAATLDDQPAERKFTLRGKTYHFVEKDILEYDDIEKQCIETEADGTERINANLRSRMLLQATSVEPKMTLAQVTHLPFSLGNSLMAVVNEMYYTIEQPKVVEDNETDDDKGEG